MLAHLACELQNSRHELIQIMAVVFLLLFAQRHCAKLAGFSKSCFYYGKKARNRQREAILRLYELHVCFLQVGVK